MPRLPSFPARFDPAQILRASRVRIGKSVRLQGVPAILIGVSCVVAAAGVARAASGMAISFAEALRDRQNAAMLESLPRRSLNP